MTNQLEAQLLEALNSVVDPNTNTSIVELDYVKRVGVNDERHVECEIEIPNTASSMKAQFKLLLEQAINKIEWVASVEVFVSVVRDATYHQDLGAC